MQDIAKLVSSMESELDSLRTRAASDEKTIELLKRQNADQAMDIARMTSDHAIALRTLKQERDVAVRRSVEVSGILDEAATSVINGLRKMREGSITPSSPPAKESSAVRDVFELASSRRLPTPSNPA